MLDYKIMYFKLFNKVSDTINILQEGQRDGEKACIESDDKPIIIPLPKLSDLEK